MAAADPVFGDLSLLSRMHEHQVKGNLLAARPRYVRDRFGEPAFAQVAARLSPVAREQFERPLLPFSWFPMAILMEIDRAIVEGPMKGELVQMKHFGAVIARYDLSTIYKVLFKIGTPAFVLRRINIAFSTYIKLGRMRGETPDTKSAVVRFSEGLLPLYLCRFGVAGWLQAAVELSGGEDVASDEVACIHDGSASCVWKVRWK